MHAILHTHLIPRCPHADLQELYGVEVSPDLISRVTDAVLEEAQE